MPKELRCGGNMHGIMLDDTHLEVKCKRRACGSKPGTVVLHVFDITTGELTRTRRFKDPMKEGTRHATGQHNAVRSA